MNVAQNQVQVNPQTGQPDYSLQWAEYYRSLGMHREAELIEQQAKNKGGAMQPGMQTPTNVSQPPSAGATPVPGGAAPGSAAVQNGAGGQPDYSAQWAEYYRGIGKIKEAEAIEAQMKQKVSWTRINILLKLIFRIVSLYPPLK